MNRILSLFSSAVLVSAFASNVSAVPDLVIDGVQYDRTSYANGELAFFTVSITNDGSKTEPADNIYDTSAFNLEIALGSTATNQLITQFNIASPFAVYNDGITYTAIPVDADGYFVFGDGTPLVYGERGGLANRYDAGIDLRVHRVGNGFVYEDGSALDGSLRGVNGTAVAPGVLSVGVFHYADSGEAFPDGILLPGSTTVTIPFAVCIPSAWASSGVYPVTVYVDPPELGNIWEDEGEGNNTYSGLPLRVNYHPSGNPDVALTPADGAILSLGGQKLISAEASDNEGSVVSVEFFVDGLRQGQPDRAAPFEVNWIPPSVGTYSVEAVATDNDGLKTFVRSVVTVEQTATNDGAPQVQLVSVAEGGWYLPGTVLPLQALAWDDDGLVFSVQFEVNGVPIGAEPYPGDSDNGLVGKTFLGSYVVPSIGDYRITAVATDNEGRTTRSASKTVHGGQPAPDAPIVRMTSPLPQGKGDNLNDCAVGSAMFLNAEIVNLTLESGPFDPDDPDGARIPVSEITGVKFFINGVELQGTGIELTGANNRLGNKWSTYFQTANVGSYIMWAEATHTYVNELGNTVEVVGVSEPIQLSVVELEAPPPDVTLDHFPDVVPVGGWVQMTATTDGGLLPVNRVDFFANGVLIGAAATEDPEPGVRSFDFIWYPEEPGTYVLHTRAIQIDPGGHTSDNWVISRRRVVVVEPAGSEGQFHVEITEPGDGNSVRVNEPMLLVADASLTLGNIERVEFFLNGGTIPVDGDFEDGLHADYVYPYQALYTPTSIGTYSFAAKAYSARGTVQWSQVVTVSTLPSNRPVVTITRPAATDIITAGSDTLIVAEASDLDGSVTQVEFRVNGVVIGTDYSAPFTAFWRPPSHGTYRIQATATDNAGLRTASYRDATVTQITGAPPSITLSLTADGNVTPGSRIMAHANVIDPDGDGTGVQVAFFLNGEQLDSDPTTDGVQADEAAPFSAIIEPVLAGGTVRRQYAVRAVVTDADGNSRAVDFNDVYISDFTQSLPVLTMRSPAAGADLTEGSRASLRVEASGSARNSIEKVVFYANGVEVGEDSVSPYTYDWVPDQLGAVEVTAAAMLPARTFAYDTTVTPFLTTQVRPVQVAAPVLVNVNPVSGILPSVSLYVLPKLEDDDPPLAQGSKVILFANVVDNDPSPANDVASVSFYVDGVKIGEATEEPYLNYWVPNHEGTFYLNAVVRDDNGNMVSSSFANATVGSSVSPTPKITLSAPVSGQSGSPLAIRATLTGFVQNPPAVVFYANGEEIGRVTQAPFNFTWVPRTQGDVYVFAAASRDLTGGGRVMTASAVHHVTLGADAVPEILEFSCSAANDTAYKNNPINFTLESSDNGFISSIYVYRNGVQINPPDDETPPMNGSIVSFTDTPPAVGRYTYYAVVTDNTGNPTVSENIVLDVVSGLPPSVAIVAPQEGSQHDVNRPITLRAQALPSNPGGEIVSLRFYRNNILIGSPDLEAPYEVDFTPTTAGAYTFTAVARDSNDNQATSAAVHVNVLADNAPQLSNFRWDAAASPLVNVPITFTVTATDDRLLTKLELMVNGEIQPSTGIPNSFTYTPTAPGTYVFQVRATDSSGQTAKSSSLMATVTRGQVPTVSITSPAAGAQLPVNMPVVIQVSAQARNPGSYITGVRFYRNNVPLAPTDAEAPFDLSYTPTAVGDQVLTALATDSNGNSVTSAAVTVTVTPDNPPTVQAPTHDAPAVPLVNVPINFTVTASDDRMLESVQLVVNGQVQPGQGVPTTLTFTPTTPGAYTFQVRATDSSGQSTVSAGVVINVQRGQSPTVSISRPAGSIDAQQDKVITIEANAADPDGSIVELQFKVNNVAVGAPLTSAPYRVSYTTGSPGTYLVTATARDNSGNITTSAPRTINVVNGSIPEITSFTCDAVNNRSLVNVPIHFTVVATDEKGITLVQLFQDDVLVDSSDTAPYVLEATPGTADPYLFHAVVRNRDGNTARSDFIRIDVTQPDPLGNVNDFIYQTFVDLQMRLPTTEELVAYRAEMNAGRSRAAIVVEILGRDRVTSDHVFGQPCADAVRQALVADHVLGPQDDARAWPTRETLEKHVELVRASGVDALVSDVLLPAWFDAYGVVPPRELPPGFYLFGDFEWSPKREALDRMFRTLWLAKYGRKAGDENKDIMQLPYPSRQQLNDAIDMYANTDFPVDYVFSGFVEYYGGYVPPVAGLEVEPWYYIYDLQNDTVVDYADTASLHVNMLRTPPTQAQVREMNELLPIRRAELILADTRYTERFPTLQGRGTVKGWRYNDWFGSYCDDKAPWIWHVGLDWIYIGNGQPETGFWFYDFELGWCFTSSNYYPYMWCADQDAWLYFFTDTTGTSSLCFYRYDVVKDGKVVKPGDYIYVHR